MILRTGRIRLFRERSLNKVLASQFHPSLIVEKLMASRGLELRLSYSRYEIAQPGMQWAAVRTPAFKVSAVDVTPNWVAAQLKELGPNEEFAFHSSVECCQANFHIPMIDFVSRPSPSSVQELETFVADEMGLNERFLFFETGRSMHGYLPDLIAEHEYPKYLGRLLTITESTVDVRWVGHALARGFAALRWSRNTDRYLMMPRLITL